MSEYFVAGITMIFMQCGKCGVPFALSNDFIEQRRKDHETWYCPKGCPRYYPDLSDEEKLKRQLKAKQKSVCFVGFIPKN